MNKRFFNQQNLTRRLRLLSVLYAMLLLPLGAWAQTITVAGVSPDTDGNFTGLSGVTFSASTNTLTLNGATITGSIVKTANEAGDQLTINLVGTNTVNGQILFQSEDRMYPGDLTFTGSGSLNIASSDENGVIDGVSSVNTGEGLYIATDSPNPRCNYGFYINSSSGSVMSLTVSTSVSYPIWVYNSGSSTKYTQLTAASSTFTTANMDDDHSGSVSFNGTTLTLNSFNCKTANDAYVFYIGESKKELTINLEGTSCIFGNCFHYLTANNTLTFKTSESTPGSLEFTTSLSFWGDVTFVYSSGLGYYSNKISTDWPRLQIGSTFVRGTASTIGGYSKVSFDDATNTLTLGGVTIGSPAETVTDIDVFIKNLNVEISGTNTVYGRFYGLYEENGYRAGTITFKKKSGAETAELTVSGLGDGNGPVTNFASSILGEGLYVSGIDDDNEPVSTLSYQGGEYCDFDNPDNTVKEVTISENEPDTKLWIGETPVTSDNAGNVFHGDEDLDGKVSYDVTNHTLSLNGATIENEIVSNVGTLTIDLTGSNSVKYISATGNATALAFTGDGTLTLENSDGVIYGFSSVDFGDFNLQSSVPGIHWSETHHILCNYDDDIAEKVTLTKDVVYQLWINGVQVTEANKNGITGEEIQSGESTLNTIEGTVKFTPGTENVLLLKKAQLSVGGDDAGPAIVSGLDNLTIQLDGDGNDIGAARSDVNFSGAYGNYIVKSINSNAVLTFTALREDACLYSTISSSQYAYAPFNGFSNIVYNGNLVLMATNTAWQCLKNLSTPSISPDGSTYYLSQEDDQLDGVKIYYTIDYVNGEDVTTPTLYKDNEGLTISGPCTLTAYAEYVQNGVTKNSSNLKAKYFGPAEDPMRLVYGADPVDFVLAPALEEDDGIKINGIEANVTYNTGKVSSSTLGRNGAIVSLGYQDETVQTTLLNNYFNMSFDVVPPAPTIGLAEGTYSSTHEAITVTSDGLANTTIKYQWDDDDEEDYPETGIPFQAGTLKAWVVYNGGDTPVSSDIVSATYTLLQDPGLDFVVGDNPVEEDVNYTIGGSSNPTLPTLQKPEGVTVTYASSNTGVATVATDGTVTPVGVGYTTITATSTATTEYAAGEASYTLNVYKDLSHSSITVEVANVTYNGQAKTPTVTVKDGDKVLMYGEDNGDGTLLYEYKVEYANNTNAASATAETGAPTVTVTAYTDDDYSESHMEVTHYRGSTTKTFTISPMSISTATVSVDATQTYTYTGSEIKPSVSVSIYLTENAENITTLTEGTDYTVTGYANNTNAATATSENAPTITITGKGNFTGTATGTFTIDQANLGDVTIAPIADQTYTGSQITPTDITVTFNGNAVSEDEYTISYGTNINVGEGTVTLTSENKNFSTTSTKGATFTIVAKALTDAMVADIAAQTYSGTELKPALTVKDGETTLEEDTHYEVTYSNNKNAGTTAKATITGKGNYSGSIDKFFTINKAQLTVTADDKTYNVGDDITLTVTITGFVNGETKTVLTAQPTASCDADVTKPGSYTITVNGGEAANYDFDYKTGTLTINRLLDVSFSASNEWVTYYASENLATPEGLQAYQVTAVDGSTVTIGEIGYIPANTAVLLKNVSNNNTWSNIAASAYTGATSTFASNKLIGTAEDVSVSSITGGTVYILINNMFRRATGTIPARRGYLVVNSSNAPQLSITIGDDTTGIGTAGCDSVATDNDEWYSIDGMKLNGQPQKPGLYIKNGKKVVINKK